MELSAEQTPPGVAAAGGGPLGLSPAKRSLLALRRARLDEPPLVAGRSGSEGFPLSSAQQRLWLLDRMTPGLTAYNVARGLRLSGAVDVAALRAALDAVVARHEVLRTTITAPDGVPRARAQPARPVELVVDDLRAIPAADRSGAANAAAAAEAGRPFDLSSDILLRGRLLRLDDAEWLLVLCTHHIASDETSRGILWAELATAYDAATAGVEPSLPALPLQYADWAAWEQQRLRGPAAAADLAWWREELSGPSGGIALPVDRPYATTAASSGGRHHDWLEPRTSADVSALARSTGSTLFHAMLGAFAVLLSRYSGTDDIVLGSPVSLRTRPETARLIGYFSNTVPLRIDLTGEPSYREVLRRVRRSVVAALSHAELPFERVVEVVGADRRRGRSPLFQVALSVEGGADDTPSFAGLTAIPVEIAPGQAKLELALVMADRGADGLRLEWEYNRALFDEGTVVRISGHLCRLLAALTDDPDAAVSGAGLTTPAERADLAIWGRASDGSGTPDEPTLPDRLATVATERPDAVAVTAVDGELTYAGLDADANRLAHHLHALGIGPGTLVAVLLERTRRLPVALLGVLRAGAAYVPIDPGFPADRIGYMLADAGCAAIVTTEPLLAGLPDIGALPVLLDEDAEVESRPSTSPDTAPGSGDLAYVIYTSGSTGRPKGVMVEHSALANFLASMAREPGMSASDALLAVTTLSFDIAGLELFLPLWVGGRVVLAGRGDALDPDRLAQLIAQERVSVMQATPATWRMLVDGGWPGEPGLTALCGGEALPAPLAAQLRRRCALVWNMYGPTETTIWSLVHRVDAVDEPIPLGHPIARTEVLVVDRSGGLTPVGAAGELLIGGAGLARGYLGRDDLTAQRFVRHPAAEGRRVYRTGDLARWRPDGRLEFLGRIDDQVKLRGFRIELGEIEAALRDCADVADAVVLLREDVPGDGRLVAYLRGSSATVPPVAELRRELSARLPGYMVPSAFVAVPEFPRTPNGKLDRAALPQPEAGLSAADSYVAPRTPVEEGLAALWVEVLGVERVGLTDDFFALGGHSLVMLQMAARARAMFQVDLPLRAAYENPSLAGMAEVLSARLMADADSAELELLLAELEGSPQQ